MGIAWAMGPIAWGYPMDCPWIGWMRADIVSWRSSKSKLNQKKIEEEEQTRGRDRWATMATSRKRHHNQLEGRAMAVQSPHLPLRLPAGAAETHRH